MEMGIYSKQFVRPSAKQPSCVTLVNSSPLHEVVIVEMNQAGIVVQMGETDKNVTMRFIPWHSVSHIDTVAEKTASTK